MQPVRSNNLSGWVGVVWDRRARRWHASIRIKGQLIHLGLFEDREEAARARAEAQVQLLKDAPLSVQR